MVAGSRFVAHISTASGNPLARDNFAKFFENFYAYTDLDKEGIEKLLVPEDDLSNVQFRTAATKMKLIRDPGQTVFVRYDETSEKLLDELNRTGPTRGLMRKLQRYTVSWQALRHFSF